MWNYRKRRFKTNEKRFSYTEEMLFSMEILPRYKKKFSHINIESKIKQAKANYDF